MNRLQRLLFIALATLAARAVCGAAENGLAERGSPPDGTGRSARSAQDLTPQSHARPPLQSQAEAEARHRALQRGLEFLVEQQRLEVDGSLPAGSGGDYAPVGVTALGALAFMAAGNTPTRGPQRDALARTVDYLLSRASTAEDKDPGYIVDEADQASKMHGHGLATLVLAEAYSSSPAAPRGRRIATALEAAVRRIEFAQGVEGGWMYEPRPQVEHEGSITVCLVQALRAAKNAGVRVAPEVIVKAVAYVKRLQRENGGFCYGLSTPERVTVALTAACLSTLQASGVYAGREIDDGYGYLWRELAAREEAVAKTDYSLAATWPYYERFYLMQTFWQHKERGVFREWYRKELKEVLGTQHDDGGWGGERDRTGRTSRRSFGRAYSTAMNCIFLALPDGLLPIFIR